MDEIRIEALAATHERGSFDCGKAPLNAFIRQHAAVNHERGVSRVYVAVSGVDNRVLAYYASSSGTFLRDHLPLDDQTGLPRYPLRGYSAPVCSPLTIPAVFSFSISSAKSC